MRSASAKRTSLRRRLGVGVGGGEAVANMPDFVFTKIVFQPKVFAMLGNDFLGFSARVSIDRMPHRLPRLELAHILSLSFGIARPLTIATSRGVSVSSPRSTRLT